MSMKLLTFEDGIVRIDGEELPGILSDLRVSGRVRFDEQSVDKASGKKKTPQGWEDADISLTLYLLTDEAGTCYDKLAVLDGFFKRTDGRANPSIFTVANSHFDSWRNNRGDKSGITRDEPGHTGKTLCNFIAWDENRRGGKSLPFSSLLDGVRVWPESLFRLSTHHGSGSVGGVLPHLGKPTVGPLAVVFFHR